MGQKRAREHHIVPKVLQRQFAMEAKPTKIWRARRTKLGEFSQVESKDIKKSFVLRDYYTVLEDGEPSDRVEKEFYGSIDNFLGVFLPLVTSAFEDGEVPVISREILHETSSTVMHMAKRTPDFLQDHSDIELGREYFELCLNYPLENDDREFIKKCRDALKNETTLIEKGRDIRVRGTLTHSDRVMSALSEFHARWVVSNTKHSFILSSRMVYCLGNRGSNGVSNPKMEMWMPISPKIALVLLRDPHGTIPMKSALKPAKIREINQYALKHSFEIASHSKKLLKSLLTHR